MFFDLQGRLVRPSPGKHWKRRGILIRVNGNVPTLTIVDTDGICPLVLAPQ
jgi:hypothetical protein